MSRVRTDLALRRLLDALKSSQDSAISSAATSISQEMETTASGFVTDHASKRQFVHGTGPYYVAKTSRGDQWPSWKDLKDIPADLQETDFDPADIEIDADQVISGVFPLVRLPVAANGESHTQKVVRSDDVRLATHQITADVAVPLYAGMFVTMREDGLCEPASSASENTAAVGFVTDSFTVGQQAHIFTYGQNPSIYLPLILSSQVLHPFYLGATPGYATMTMPSSGIEQQLGVITSLVSTTIARGMVVIQKATAFVGV